MNCYLPELYERAGNFVFPEIDMKINELKRICFRLSAEVDNLNIEGMRLNPEVLTQMEDSFYDIFEEELDEELSKDVENE